MSPALLHASATIIDVIKRTTRVPLGLSGTQSIARRGWTRLIALARRRDERVAVQEDEISAAGNRRRANVVAEGVRRNDHAVAGLNEREARRVDELRRAGADDDALDGLGSRVERQRCARRWTSGSGYRAIDARAMASRTLGAGPYGLTQTLKSQD